MAEFDVDIGDFLIDHGVQSAFRLPFHHSALRLVETRRVLRAVRYFQPEIFISYLVWQKQKLT